MSAPPFAGWVLVWRFGGFSEVEVVGLAAGRAVVRVAVGQVALASGRADYPEVPLDAIAVDPAGYAAAAGSPALAAELRGGVVVSRGFATRRALHVGDSLPVGGGTVTVAGVVADALLGGYELAIDVVGGRGLGLDRTTYVLVPGGGATSTAALGSPPVRVRSPGERRYLRAADDVLPLGEVKARFGEFAVRRSGDDVTIDPAWVSRNIVTRTVPLLGIVRCHRGIVDDLTGALAEIDRAGLGDRLDPADFRRSGGCFHPRPLRGGDGALSRHSWGIALDVNVAANPLGAAPSMDAGVVAAFARHGFTWGGNWLRPDGGHFEWVGEYGAAQE